MNTTASAEKICKNLRVYFGKFPQVTHVIQRLEELYKYDCKIDEPNNLVLLGEPGVGKSRLLKKFCDAHPAIEHAEFTEIPVLYVPVPSKCNIEALASAMLRALGSPFWDRGKEKQLTAQLKCLLRTCNVRMIILDEVNHLVDKGGVKTHHLIADWIKALIDDVRLPCVLTGIPRAQRLLNTNDQLRSRFREVITIKPFSVENDEAKLEFRGVLKTFAKLMEGITSVDISHENLVRNFAFATDGRLRDIRQLLVRAVEHSFAGPTPKLTYDVLAKSFREVIYPDVPEGRNPFCSKFTGSPLVRPGEPFAPREE